MFDKDKIAEFFKKGKEKEKEFLSVIDDGIKKQEASKNEDISEHWDLKLTEIIKIDVKSIKRDSRHGSFNENIHWIEIRGVKDEGWLFGGKADYICFETVDYWILVSRERLMEFVSKKCEHKIKTTNPEDALYKLYRRKGRNDILTKIKTIDLMFISEKILEKQKEE